MHKIEIKSNRIAPEEKDPALFYYGIRHVDGDWGTPATIEPFVAVNFWGTLISTNSLSDLFKTADYYDLEPEQVSVLFNQADSGEAFDAALLFPSLKKTEA